MFDNKHLIVGVAGVIRYSSDLHRPSLLLGKRIGKTGNGLLQCAGGHPEPGELFSKTIEREIREEIGFSLLDLHIHNEIMCYQDDYFENIDRWYRTFFIPIDCYTWEIPPNPEPDKCEGWSWYNPDMLILHHDLFAINANTFEQMKNFARFY